MRAPATVHGDVPAALLVEGDRIVRTLEAMFRAHATGRSMDAIVLDGLMALIACDFVTYVEDQDDGSRQISSRTRLRNGWSRLRRSTGDEPSRDLGVYRIGEVVTAPDGTGVSYRCARARVPFDALDDQLLDLLRPCVTHILSDHRRAASDLPLTSREVEVLARVARGFTNAEVAAQLFVAPGTVKKHLDHIYRKLGVKGRTGAAARFSGRLAEREGSFTEP